MNDETGSALSLFHPLIKAWFLRSVGRPTEVQERAWPEIARGSHVLVSAPTGTGKTFAAFLWGINQLATGVLSPGKVRILYVSPLKALNNDIQRNLLSPLQELTAVFQQAGHSLPPIRVLTRSGDTSSTERQRMVRHPPEILITTPESFNLILSSPNGRLMLDGVAAVILDEIHAVAATKRGTHLVTAVDRLVRLAGEFQRIALSATVKPLSVVADLVGGFHSEGSGGEPVYRKRRVQIVHCPMAKDYDIRISYPAVAPTYSADFAQASAPGEEPLFDALARECRKIIAENRSTLFFVNSRRHAEKLARFINEGQPQTLAWSHHGSLSRELRLVVEQRLKRGELKAIVATSSLELGIDVGSLDQVILVQTPFSVASAVQRLGRAGHSVGQPSRGVIFPLHGKDIVDAAVTARCIREQDIDTITPVTCPLDVLAQVIVSMTAVEIWKVDELYNFIRAGFPYHTLARRQFDLVLDMLAGKYEETRLRDLAPMISYDRIDSTVRAREGARIRLATSGGTIPDRGYFSLRAADSKTLIGELDEEFVWERSLGDSFVFGTQGWRIQKIDHQNVEVVPVATRIGMSPFWKAEERNRDFHISDRISRALEDWNGKITKTAFPAALEASHGLEPDAARAMTEFLARQREATGADLPHRHHLLVEHTRDPDGKAGAKSAGYVGAKSAEYVGTENIVLHTMWGGRVNKPFGLALSAAWEEKYGYRPEMFQNNDAILLFLPEARSAHEILSLVQAGSLERLLRRSLEGSGFFGARFRESAGRALLLPRPSARRRMPFWLTRQRAKSLFSAVSRYDDFPLLLEAWRTCLRDEFDLPNLGMLLEELDSGVIEVGEVSTPAPSPFCNGLLWKQTNSLMYADDTPPGAGGTALRGELVRELALSPDLRPRLAARVIADFQAKLQRTGEGYAPRDARELLDWVKERIILPHEEWQALLHACARDHGSSPEALEETLGPKIVTRAFGELPCVLARETLPRVERALQASEGDAKSAEYVDAKSAEYVDALAELLSEWLRSYGPIEPSFVRSIFGLTQDRLEALIQELAEEEQVVLDQLAAGSQALLLCDRENLEILLRVSRARARPAVRTLPVERLPLFIARRQGLIERGGGPDDMKSKWEKLFGLPLPARAWEEEVFPSRLREYRTRWLDGLLAEAVLLWLGCGNQRITFCFREDTELFLESSPEETRAEALFESGAGKYSFWDLADKLRLSSAELADRLWDLAWKGMVSCDSFQALRKGVDSGFRAEEAPRSDPHRGTPQNPHRGTSRILRSTAMRILRRRAPGRGRPGFDRWQSTRPSSGFWFRVPHEREGRDALDEEEIVRDRIRQVLQRYGVLFREILEYELPLLRWSRLFRSLRLMEFSGEVVAGRFFEGIKGLQFADPSLIEEWGGAESAEYGGAAYADQVWWVNAADPASLCGVDIESLKQVLPSRLPTTHVVFQGDTVVLVSRRKGLELEFRVPPESPRIPEYLSFVKVLTGREWRPMSAVRVETINSEPVGKSPYKERLLEFGFVEDYRRLTYRARI
jgi:ATP-dependent Lhr-like helicase